MVKLEYKGISGSYDFDEKKKIFTGCLSRKQVGQHTYFFGGDHVSEVEDNFRKTVLNYIEMTKKTEVNPKYLDGHINIIIDPLLHQALFLKAKLNNMSVNDYIIRFINETAQW